MSFKQNWHTRLQQAKSIQTKKLVIKIPQFMQNKRLKDRIEKILANFIISYDKLPSDSNVFLIDMSNAPPDPDPVLDNQHLQVLKEYR